MTNSQSISKGDTGGAWNVGVPDDSGVLQTITAPWTCKIKVAGSTIERTVTDRTIDDKRFIAALTPAETSTLAVGQYVDAIENDNTTTIPPFRKEEFIILNVGEQIIGSDYVPELPNAVAELNADLALVQAAIRTLLSGKMVKDVSRDGRRIVKSNPSYSDLIAREQLLERKIAEAENVASGRARRRPIRLGWAY